MAFVKNTNRSIKDVLMLCCAIAFNTAMPVYAEETEPSATPYRPTVSNPADLSELGWLEVELGFQRIKGGDDKWRDSYPLLAKLAFSENWGVLVGSELGVQRTDMDDVMYKGSGDTLFVLKHRIPTASAGTAWGFEAGYKSPTANDSIGSGQADYLLNGIFSTQFSGHTLDLNVGATRVGGVSDGVGLYLYNWATSVSRNLDEKLGVFGELSGTTQTGMPDKSQFMAGITYNFSRRVVFDAGASSGLTKASQEWTVFAGVTSLLGKLW